MFVSCVILKICVRASEKARSLTKTGGPHSQSKSLPLLIAPEKQGLTLDPSLDPNAPLRDETKRDERGSHLPLEH